MCLVPTCAVCGFIWRHFQSETPIYSATLLLIRPKNWKFEILATLKFLIAVFFFRFHRFPVVLAQTILMLISINLIVILQRPVILIVNLMLAAGCYFLFEVWKKKSKNNRSVSLVYLKAYTCFQINTELN